MSPEPGTLTPRHTLSRADGSGESACEPLFSRCEVQPTDAVRQRELGQAGRRGQNWVFGGQSSPAGAQSHTPRHAKPQTGEKIQGWWPFNQKLSKTKMTFNPFFSKLSKLAFTTPTSLSDVAAIFVYVSRTCYRCVAMVCSGLRCPVGVRCHQ